MAVLEEILIQARVFGEDPDLTTAREHIQNNRFNIAITTLEPIRNNPTFNYEGTDFERSKGNEAHFLTGVAEYKRARQDGNPQEALNMLTDLKAFSHGGRVLDFPDARKKTLKELLTIEEAAIWMDQSVLEGARDILKDVSDTAAGGEKVFMLASMDFQEGKYKEAAKGYVRAHEINPSRPGGKDKVISAYETLENPAVTPNPTSDYSSLPKGIVTKFREAERKFSRRALTDARAIFEGVITDLNQYASSGFRGRHRVSVVPDSEAKRAMEARALLYLAKINRVEGRDLDAAREALNRSISIAPTQEAYRTMAQVYRAMP